MSSSIDALLKIGAPATRALQAAGYTELRQLAGALRSDLARLHGRGPKALGIIEARSRSTASVSVDVVICDAGTLTAAAATLGEPTTAPDRAAGPFDGI